jgi:hypothetical protein
MKYLISITTILFTLNIKAWTLSRSDRLGFSSNKIRVLIGSDSCTNAGITASELRSYTVDAVEEFWAKVSTSSLELNVEEVSNISLSGDTLSTAVNKIDNNSIIIGCNDNSTIFTSNNILGVGGLGCAGTDCSGAVLMNNKTGTVLASSDRQTIVAALAHELGHAFGLGHTSVKSALMYYDATGVINKALHQDDIDGVSYLYPSEKKLGGLLGSCSTVMRTKTLDKNFLVSLLLGLFLGVSAFGMKKRGLFTKK